MDDKELTQEFNLDDIMKEFSEADEAPAADVAEEPAAPVTEDTAVFTPVEEAPASTATDEPTQVVGTVSSDTVRLENISDAQPAQPDLAETQRFDPIGQEEDAPEALPEAEEPPNPSPASGNPSMSSPWANTFPPSPLFSDPDPGFRS